MHLKEGDPKPVIKPNEYSLLGYRFCPFVERVRLVLAYHKIPYNPIWVSLHSKPKWFLEMYPVGKVPLLITKEGKTIAESDVIMRYVDETKGPDSLLARCGEAEFKRAETLVSKLVASYYRILYTADFTEQDAILFREGCQAINDAIKGPYFLGNEISLADFLLLAHLNRFEPVMARLDGIAPKDVRDLKQKDKNYEKWPRLGAFLETMRRQPFVESVRVPAHTQAMYAQSLRQGLPNPDLQD